MEYTIIFWIIIAIIVADYSLEAILDHLNGKNASAELPDEVKGIYNAEKYNKQQSYFQTNQKFNILSNSFSTALILAMMFFSGFGFVDDLARESVDGSILTGLVFFGILFFANEIITIPFSAYKTFVIEEKFGFNKITPKLFVSDLIKNWVMTGLIGSALISLIIFLYETLGDNFWIAGWILLTCLSIFMMMFYSNIIVPLFNKQSPLEEGDLRNAIEDFCKKVDFKLDNLYVIDGSKRTTKANAYFSGLGAKKRIVLYDTLINTLTTDEIVAVLAHEIGHYKKKHTLKNLILSIINNGIMFFLLSLFLGNKELAEAMGSNEPSFHICIMAFMMLFTPISTFFSTGVYARSRAFEYQADQFAKQHGLAEPLCSALKKLSESSLSNLTPHPLYVMFHYSHPTLLQRLRALNK